MMLLRLILHIVVSLFRSRATLVAEILILRQQLNVLRRQVSKRPQLGNTDRCLFVWLFRWFPSVLGAIAILRPETIIRWHRTGFRSRFLRTADQGARPPRTDHVGRHAAVISAGEWVTASGEWINDRTHGQQFKARFLKTSEPTSIDGIEKYLGSDMIRGIGPV